MLNSAFVSSSSSRCTNAQKCNLPPLMFKTNRFQLNALSHVSLPLSDLTFTENDTVGTSTLQLSTITSDMEPIQSFEPVVNVPALSSFMLIVVVFGFLQLRINSIGNAVNRRTTALENLRRVKAKQLSVATNSNDPNDGKDLVAEINSAMEEYKMALTEEKDLRTIISGVRIAAPNRPDSNDENVAAAKLFLNIDLQAEYDMESKSEETKETTPSSASENMQNNNNNWITSGNTEKDDQSPDLMKGFSGGAVATMALIVTTQIALLYMLSFDPMKASTTFSSI